MTPHSDSGIIDERSQHSVEQTVERFTALLHAKGVTLFALVDHSAEAAEAPKPGAAGSSPAGPVQSVKPHRELRRSEPLSSCTSKAISARVSVRLVAPLVPTSLLELRRWQNQSSEGAPPGLEPGKFDSCPACVYKLNH